MASLFRPFGSITVFGGATIDRIARSAAPAVRGASNPGTASATPGGVAFNVATILAKLGHTVRLVARVGNDPWGQQIIATARDAGVDTTAITTSPAAGTATYQAALDSDGSLVVGIADMTVHDEMSPALVAEATAHAPANDLFVADANLPAETLSHLIDEAHASARTLVALPVSPAKCVRLMPSLDRIPLLFTNRKEAAVISGSDGATDVPATTLAEMLHRAGPTDVVVTDADRLLACVSDGESRVFAPFPARIHSVNGAGDALAAGTIHGLQEGRTLVEAIPFGLAAAAITIEDDGTIPHRMTAAMLQARISSAEATP